MNVIWTKCTGNVWCTLNRVNLSTVETEGVYVIWKPGSNGCPGQAVRVGQGDIQDRLVTHRNDPEITKYGSDLCVTWVAVESRYRDGVERYLAEQCSPLVGERFPLVTPIPVNLP